nr:hypothetical protein [Tanacetum cinerariifolium]
MLFEVNIGLKKFIDDCKPLVDSVGNIRCPCKSCRLVLWVSIKHLSDHISKYGFNPSYKTWIHHGDICETNNDPTQAKRNEFEDLYVSAKEELNPGCDYVTRLDFMANVTYFKVKGKLTDFIFNEMLEVFQNVFPTAKGYKLPPSYYAIKKTFKMIGLGYESIHACVNDCFLFQGDANKDVHFCPTCNTSRWKDSNTPGKKVPKKVLCCYFSIIPRLQLLNKSSHTAKEMIWHVTGKCMEPDKMQHLVDGRAWKDFDTKYLDFAAEPRNVRSGLAADRFNSFGNLSQSYSMWPVILTTYNLPPWLCMKESSFMLTLLIPGLKSSGKDVDVYLRPLIDDLKDLWAKPEESLTFSSHYFRDVTIKFNRPDRNVDCPHPTCQFQVFKSLCKSIGLRLVIRIDHQELKQVIWYVLHNSPEIDTYRAKFKSEFPNKDMEEEFLGWFGKQIRQRHVDNDLGVSESTELFALACGPSQTPISVNSCVVNNVRFVMHNRDERRTTQNSGICSLSPDGEIYYDVARGHGSDGSGDDRKDTRKPNLGGRRAGMMHTRQETRNLGLKAIIDKNGPVPIRFEFGNRETLMPLGDHAAHWANYLGELVRELPLHYPSCRQMSPERNAGFVAKIKTQFDLRPHMESDRRPQIYAGIQQHLQKIYNSKKATLKKDGELSYSRDEMLRLQGLGSNISSGVPYTDDEIMVIVREGKQWWHIPGVGRVLPGQGRVIPPSPQCTHSFVVAKLKKSEKLLTNRYGDDEPGDDEDGDEDEDDS